MDYTITIELDAIAERLGCSPERVKEALDQKEFLWEPEVVEVLESIAGEAIEEA